MEIVLGAVAKIVSISIKFDGCLAATGKANDVAFLHSYRFCFWMVGVALIDNLEISKLFKINKTSLLSELTGRGKDFHSDTLFGIESNL